MRDSSMDLSIIIVSYNTKSLTLACLNSIFGEGSDLAYEVIVVDNGSKDGSVEALTNLKESQNQKLKLLENKENLGFSKANNQGIKIAKGNYILLLNSDTEIISGALDKLVAFANNTPDAGVIGAKLLNPNGSTQPSCLNLPSLSLAVREYFLGEKGLTSKFFPQTKQASPVDAVVGAAFLITQQAIRKVGLLDERYFFYFEDLDYCRKVKKSGLKTYYLPDATVIHYHGASGKSEGEKQQTNKLIASSKVYHGMVGYYLYTLVLWLGQKWQRFLKTQK